MKKEKIQYVSAMRVMAMTMIITFHSMLFYTGTWWVFDGPVIPLWVKASQFLDTIDLPMFVFIAGFLFGHLYKYENRYRDKMSFVIGKAKRLLIPYLFWGLFLIYALPPYNQLVELLTGISHLWFLLMLFDIFLLSIVATSVLFQGDSPFLWMVLFAGSCLLFCAFHAFSTHHHFLCIHSALFYLPAFILGVCFACLRLHNLISYKTAVITLIVALVIHAFYIFRCSVLPYFVNYCILLITGYTITASIFVLLSKSTKYSPRASALIAHFDRLSMGIYIFNQITINVFLCIPGVVPFLRAHYYIGVPIIFLAGFVIPWLLSLLFNRFKKLKWLIG